MSALMFTITSYIAGVKARLTSEEKGATMVEYGIMVALIAVVVLAAVGPLGTAIHDMFADVTTKI
ncbi:Flp family type IVb pilin [Paenarthrobacter sp. YIM B13468]|uniref:Flp family type IVb pilin n=1 Tax=Paenarthrobacter sp. YIM B13468 TaxID=3366295 RepID=UPI0036730D6A